MENSDEMKHDQALLKIFEDENHSVNRFFDAIFGFFSRNSPELIYDTSKHYGKQLLVSNYEKWQHKYLKTQKSPIASAKRVKNDSGSDIADEERKIYWSEAPNPGGPTNTTNTTTVSKRSAGDDISTRSTKSKIVEKRKLLHFDTTNGAIFDNYSWTQTTDDVDLRIPVGENILKGNQIKVHIDKTNLKVEVLGIDSSEYDTVLEGVFVHPVRMDDCVWLLSPGQHIAILLEKTEEKWWDRCLMQESPIDMKKINAERAFHTLPEEDRIQIEKIISDKHKKERGEPTSDQERPKSSATTTLISEQPLRTSRRNSPPPAKRSRITEGSDD